jgi:O-antigen/teichoic acid export membrane protein
MTTRNKEADGAATSMRSDTLRGAVLVGIGLGVGQVISYLLSLVSARVLGPAEFGALGAMLALALLGNVVALGVQAAGARRIVLAPGPDGRRVSAGVLNASVWAGIAVALATAIISPILGHLLHLDGPLPVLLIALALLPATIMGGLLGIAQGAEAHLRLAILCAINGAARAIGGIAGVIVGGSLLSALVGIVIGVSVGTIASWLIADKLISRPSLKLPHFTGDVLHATHALFALFTLTNIDVLLARHFLPATQAGMYAAGAVVGKVTFWLPQFVATVAYPRLADSRRARTLGLGALAVILIGAAATLLVALLPDLVVEFIGGAAYQGLVSDVWVFAAAGAMYALAQFLLYGQIAASKQAAIVVLWIAAVGLVALVWVMHNSVLQVAVLVLCVASLVALIGVIELLVERMRDERGERASG